MLPTPLPHSGRASPLSARSTPPMATERKALVVLYTPDGESESLAELNALLNDDWRLMSSSAMGGAGGSGAHQFASLVILEREQRKTVGGFTSG